MSHLPCLYKILQHNGHSIMQSVLSVENTQFCMEAVGTAIYANMAFLNHSCDPNTIKYFEGSRVVLVATRPIVKGEEVTDNYGPHFGHSTVQSRNSWLKVTFKLTLNCYLCTEILLFRQQ